jgi:flavorubredoxin
MDFKNLFDEAATQGIDLRGKLAAVFGSYGWSGQAPQLVADLLKDKFGMAVIGAPLKAKYAPDQNMLNECRDLGRMVAESLMNSA